MLFSLATMAQGWPANYDGVMLQGFFWDSYNDTNWANLEQQSDELSQYFNLVWVPNSAYAGSMSNNMGYHPVYWYKHDSAFGTEAQLRQMIKSFGAKGLGVIEDVVINHRNGVADWTDFPAEKVDGVTWQLTANDICNDDEAKQAGKAVGPNADTGGSWGGARDLDHTSSNVQNNVVNYLRYLKDNLGYVGYRYDFVKGYAPRYTGQYNNTVKPKFSVGECWDGLDVIKQWVNGTRVDGAIQSAAFDFPMKYQIHDALSDGNWQKLKEASLAGDPAYARYAVTFVDNHDTGRPGPDGSSPLYAHVAAGNAYILAMPGTPCVWLSHWKSEKTMIKKLIVARKAAGLTNQSAILKAETVSGGFVLNTKGTKGNVLLLLGNVTGYATNGYKLAVEGDYFKLYVSEGVDISAIGSIKDEDKSSLIPSFCKVNEGETCAFFEAPASWTKAIKCWAWDGAGNYTGGNWPGADCEYLGTAQNGNKVYKWTWDGTYKGTGTAGKPTNVIFSNSGTPQQADKVFENGGYYNVDGLVANVLTGIGEVKAEAVAAADAWYTLQGVRIGKPSKAGIYIHNGKKVIKK